MWRWSVFKLINEWPVMKRAKEIVSKLLCAISLLVSFSVYPFSRHRWMLSHAYDNVRWQIPGRFGKSIRRSVLTSRLLPKGRREWPGEVQRVNGNRRVLFKRPVHLTVRSGIGIPKPLQSFFLSSEPASANLKIFLFAICVCKAIRSSITGT